MDFIEFKDVIKTSLTEGDRFSLLDIAFTLKKHSVSNTDTLSLVNSCMREIDTDFENGIIPFEQLVNASDNYNTFITVVSEQ